MTRFQTRLLVLILVSACFIGAAAHAQPTEALDQAVAARLEEHAAQGGAFFYTAVGQTVDERAGVVYLSLVHTETGESIPGLIDLALVALERRAWSVALPGDAGYNAVYSRISPAVLSMIDARPYKPAADPTLTDARSLRSYRFPWVSGQWATVTRSYNRHGLGQIDFDLGAPEIAAMRDGVIVYANDQNGTNGYNEGAWWYWNAIVIEHAPNEYALYGHIAPNSIPGWIKDGCSSDLSRANCAVPIAAGEIIATEGSTGYSSNPHLHIEFGQQWGIAPYRDTKDQDRDGDRVETIFAPYIYAEHNAGFRGYTPADVGNWTYGTVLQAYHGASAPADQNIVRNGDFSADLAHWSASGQISWAVRDGMLRFFRLNTADPPDWASFYQNLGYGADANTPFEVQIALGNDSDFQKTVTVILRNAAGARYGVIECRFSLPPRAPLETRTMRGVTNATWGLLRLEVFVNPPDSISAALADAISVQRKPSLSLTAAECN